MTLEQEWQRYELELAAHEAKLPPKVREDRVKLRALFKPPNEALKRFILDSKRFG